ncbi:GAF domain-containing protein [Megalodesulfovibrio gigas]|uniref:Putative phytochrome sensor protein n=1 Tax=Megalodesulfovibrio gigas (strain ATCC 19364 / DSM 1382 / NCIMB 9332 / VKM B-1759) TaxID=1121448 RepID=T2GD92_MEGG1|nr:GAF domain-containing protein [Megalodesulfovibrio gigas]AGW14278.1 putative phytochrome sensor protein [Megalodesulfovibrio gigas DSM 1382 = ATCC 19364]
MDRFERYFRTLTAVAKCVNSSLEPVQVLKDVTHQTALALHAKGCTLRLLDRTGKRLLPGAGWGLSETYTRKGPVDLEKSQVDREATTGKAIHLEDAQTDPRFQYRDAAKAEGIVSVLVIPLMVNGKAIGAMRVYSETKRNFDEQEMEFAQAIADLCAMAIENARLHQALKTDYEMLVKFESRIFED